MLVPLTMRLFVTPLVAISGTAGRVGRAEGKAGDRTGLQGQAAGERERAAARAGDRSRDAVALAH